MSQTRASRSSSRPPSEAGDEPSAHLTGVLSTLQEQMAAMQKQITSLQQRSVAASEAQTAAAVSAALVSMAAGQPQGTQEGRTIPAAPEPQTQSRAPPLSQLEYPPGLQLPRPTGY